MVLEHKWRTHKGTLTTDNRDCYGIARSGEAALYLVVDGSTTTPRSGQLAQDLIDYIVNEFPRMTLPLNSKSLILLLKNAHANLRFKYPGDTASYCLAVQIADNRLLTLHAGDCRLGRIRSDQTITWLVSPHTLANAIVDIPEHELGAHPERHYLTRSFRGRRYDQPETREFSLYARDKLIIATDGYWADLPHESRISFLDGNPLPPDYSGDDVSALILNR